MEKRNTLILTIIAIIALLTSVIGATFAFFMAEINTAKGNVNLTLNSSSNKAVFTASSTGDVNINVDAYMMQVHDATNGDITSNNAEIANDLVSSASINVSLISSEDNQETKCTYDLVFVWDKESGSNFTDKGSVQEKSVNGSKYYESKYYVRSNNTTIEGFKEFTIEIDETSGLASDDRLTSSESLREVNMDTFNIDTDGKMILLKTQVISSRSRTTSTVANYNITFRFYNLKTDQSSLKGKKFKGMVVIENVIC